LVFSRAWTDGQTPHEVIDEGEQLGQSEDDRQAR